MIKSIKSASQRVAGLGLRHCELATWPAWAGNLMHIKVPRNVVPNPSASAEGGADIDIILNLINRVGNIPGDVIECGVYQGQTLIPLALYLKQSGQDRLLHGFDSFEGFDDNVNFDLELAGQTDLQLRIGGFGDTSAKFVEARLRALGLHNRVKIHEGFFQDTLPNLPRSPIAFAHLDCDIYESYNICLTAIYPILSNDGIILFDEYNDPHWPGCNKAIDEFLARSGEDIHCITLNNHTKYFIRKINNHRSEL